MFIPFPAIYSFLKLIVHSQKVIHKHYLGIIKLIALSLLPQNNFILLKLVTQCSLKLLILSPLTFPHHHLDLIPTGHILPFP